MDVDVNTTLNGQTLESLLKLSSKDLIAGLDRDTLLREAREDGSFAEWLAKTTWPSLSKNVAAATCGLLSDNLVDIFAGAWCKFSELKKCAKETVKHQGSMSSVVVGDHDFTYKIEPKLEIQLNGKKVGEIPFAIEVTFTVNAMVLEIVAGTVRKVRTGRLKWSAHINCGSKEVWSHELGGLDLPGELNLRHPMPILRNEPHESSATSFP